LNLIHRRGAEDAEDAEFPQREITEQVIAAALEVHIVLGPGLVESVYHHAMARELELRAVAFESQVAVPIHNLQAGLLINFNTPALRLGLKRVVNSLRTSASSAPLR
jgi:PD-(D/E)XK nuclease superfamily